MQGHHLITVTSHEHNGALCHPPVGCLFDSLFCSRKHQRFALVALVKEGFTSDGRFPLAKGQYAECISMSRRLCVIFDTNSTAGWGMLLLPAKMIHTSRQLISGVRQVLQRITNKPVFKIQIQILYCINNLQPRKVGLLWQRVLYMIWRWFETK